MRDEEVKIEIAVGTYHKWLSRGEIRTIAKSLNSRRIFNFKLGLTGLYINEEKKNTISRER